MSRFRSSFGEECQSLDQALERNVKFRSSLGEECQGLDQALERNAFERNIKV